MTPLKKVLSGKALLAVMAPFAIGVAHAAEPAAPEPEETPAPEEPAPEEEAPEA